MKLIKTFLLVLVFVFPAAPLAAETVTLPESSRRDAGGILFHARDAAVGASGCRTQTPCPDSGLLTVDFEMTNISGTRKLDYGRPFEFMLKDEFGNIYRRMPAPEDFSGEVFEPGPHFPSIYPGENVRQKLFFERPVEASRKLFLTIEPGMKDAPPVVELALPPVRSVLPALSKGRMPTEDDLRIVTLWPGLEVRPGESVPFRIILSGDLLPPEKIFVFLPRTVYEDEDLIYQYQVAIPDDQPPGMLTIVVVAKWGGILEGATVSKSFTLDVREKTETSLQ